MTPAYERARSIALMLMGDDLATEEGVGRAVDAALMAVAGMAGNEPIDREVLVREVESKVRVWVVSPVCSMTTRSPGVAVRS